MFSNVTYGEEMDSGVSPTEKKAILILSSYNPDIKRMNRFISDFESTIVSKSTEYNIFIEDLNFKGIDEATTWKSTFNQVFNKYKDTNVKAVILLGQEAWATYLSLGNDRPNVPFFGSIASENGIYISGDTLPKYPQTLDFIKMADKFGHSGGALNRYDVQKNIDLIKTIYSNVKNIALISDNTYGGISLQSLFISKMKREIDLSYTLLDARDGIDVIEKRISKLPDNSVIILGTWRTGDKGQYLMHSSLKELLSLTENPVFTISGIGIGSLAIGGAMPIYDNHAKEIARQIIDFYNGDSTAIKFIDPQYEYHFDNGMLKKYGIKQYQLPKGSVITDMTEAKLLEYQKYIYVGSTILLLLIGIIIFILFLYIRNKRLKDRLKTRELELIAAKEKAEESDALKTSFLANMSHEIRTPLNAIAGFSSIICEDDTTDEERDSYKSIIKSNTEMLLTLINDILDISRLQATSISFNNEDTDIIPLMREVIYTTNHRNTIGLDIILDSSLDSFILNIDRKRLAQVLINLMTNAYKFTTEGNITMSLKVENDNCIFAVSDTGIGIPSELQNKVFERFEKVNDFGQGTGLGLAISKQIITKFGGRIFIDPDYTQGTKVVFIIPINK